MHKHSDIVNIILPIAGRMLVIISSILRPKKRLTVNGG